MRGMSRDWMISIRRACGALDFDRSTYHYTSRHPDQAGLERPIRELCETRVRYATGRCMSCWSVKGGAPTSNEPIASTHGFRWSKTPQWLFPTRFRSSTPAGCPLFVSLQPPPAACIAGEIDVIELPCRPPNEPSLARAFLTLADRTLQPTQACRYWEVACR